MHGFVRFTLLKKQVRVVTCVTGLGNVVYT